MLARQWNKAPRIDADDILSIEFADADDPHLKEFGYDFVADVEVAYGHRCLADFTLEHWNHAVVIDSEHDELVYQCLNCQVALILERRSLKGMEPE